MLLGTIASALRRIAVDPVDVYYETLLTSTPWAYYPLDDSSYPNILDASGSRDIITINNPLLSQTALSGGSGTAIGFQGVNQYLSSGNNTYGTAIQADFDGDKALSFEVTLNTEDTSIIQGIMHIGNFSLSNGQGVLIRVESNGALSFIGRLDSTFKTVSTSAGVIQPNTNYHAVVTRAIGGDVNIWINGSLVATGSATGAIRAISSGSQGGQRVVMGCIMGEAGSGNPASFFKGRLDNGVIYNRVLSNSEIIDHAEKAF